MVSRRHAERKVEFVTQQTEHSAYPSTYKQHTNPTGLPVLEVLTFFAARAAPEQGVRVDDENAAQIATSPALAPLT
jgi:hypothetical protein